MSLSSDLSHPRDWCSETTWGFCAQLGKLLVFKSGAVKLQLGKVLLDVTACGESGIQQEVVCVNTSDKETAGSSGDIIFLGSLHHEVVVSPDIEQLLK